MDAIEAAYVSASDRLNGITLDQFRRAIEECSVYPVTVSGRIAGAVIVKGSEIHACILPFAQKIWFKREHARILNRVIHQHGKATTTATTQAGRDFVERLGFIQDGDIFCKRGSLWALKH